jgi:apolipoprotein N-acyltransferase
MKKVELSPAEAPARASARFFRSLSAALSARRALARAPTLRLLLWGAVSALGFPPFFLFPLTLLGLAALWRAIEAAEGGRGAAKAGFVFAFGQNLVGLYWITEAILIEAERYWWFVPIAVPGLSVLMALFTAAVAGGARLVPAPLPRLLAFSGSWIAAELLRQKIAGGFPWNPLASLAAFPGPAGAFLLQPLAVIGTPGLSGAVLLLALLPAALSWRRGGLLSLAGLLLWVGGSAALWWGRKPGPAPHLTAILVQGNIAEGEKWSAARASAIFYRYLDLTREGVYEAALRGESRHLVIWPETASPYPLLEDEGARVAITEAAAGPALIGTVRWGGDGRPRNSLVLLDARGAVQGVYDKHHLVPGGEYQPDWLPLPVQIVPGGGFAPGPGPKTLHGPGLPAMGPLICYEAIYPGEIVAERDRPAFLVNVTNDAWFGNSSGPRQHLAAARMRAVEEGLPLLRAANTGISAAFDGFGQSLGMIGLDRMGVLLVEVPGALPPPPFSRFGLDIPLGLSLLLLAASGGVWLFNFRKRNAG